MPVLGQPGVFQRAGDAEIDEVGEVVLVEQDVGRFDVAVDQPDLVGGMQRLGDLLDDAHRPRRRQRAVGEHACRSRPSISRMSHVQSAVDLAVVVDRDDVWAVEPCRGVGFAAEPPLKLSSSARCAGNTLIATFGRWRRRGPATPRPCRRGPATRAAGSCPKGVSSTSASRQRRFGKYSKPSQQLTLKRTPALDRVLARRDDRPVAS